MEVKKYMRKLKNKEKKYIFIAILFFIFMLLILKKINKEINMPPPLVYLIPENYYGPVFVFFGQKDGVNMTPDPLGHSVLIPENGLVKIKLEVSEVLNDEDDKQNIYWISISKDGTRKKMVVNESSRQDDNGKYYTVIYDENGDIKKYPFIEEKIPFYYFSPVQKKENMVFDRIGCKNQGFKPLNDNSKKSPACGKFLVISPEKYFDMPDWLWAGTGRYYTSIHELENQLNNIAKKKNSTVIYEI